MSEAIVCRLCINPCNDYRQLYDDPVVYEITVKYFDPMFLNLQHNLTAICMKCWCHIVGFHSFQQSVLQAQTKFVKQEEEEDGMPDTVCIKSELPEFQDDSIRDEGCIVSDASQCPTNNEVIVKDELVLTDVHSESQYSSDEEMSLQESEFMEDEATTVTHKQNITINTNDAQSKDDNLKTGHNGDNPKRKTTQRSTAQKRKSIKQLDDLIAQWRPTLECLVCQMSFSRFTLLQTHFHREHPDEEFYVLCCKTKFRRRYSIEEHVRFHINQGEFDCKICGKGHTNKLNLTSHMSYWHPKTSKPLGDGNPAFNCDECGKPHPTAGALRKHKHRHKHQRSLKATHVPN